MDEQKSILREPTYSFPCKESVTVVEFSPFTKSSGLIAYAGYKHIDIGICGFQDEDSNIDGFQYEHLKSFDHDQGRVDAIAWSPESCIDYLPKCIKFCTAAANFSIGYYETDLKDYNECKTFKGHQNYVNAVTFEPIEGGQHLASVSDDCTCRIWTTSGEQKACFLLASAGISVCWPPQEPNKLMVAEKQGVVRFYDLMTHQPIMSLSSSQPLQSADLCPSNLLRVGGVTIDSWLLWDISQSCLPGESHQAHKEGGRQFRWSRVSPNVFATASSLTCELKIFHLGQYQVPVTSKVKVLSSLTWHPRLPVCAAGSDRKICLWKTEA